MTSKKAAADRQASIHAALTFLEAQKNNPGRPLRVRQVALEYGVPVQTLRDAIKRGATPSRPGPTILTSDEENELVGYCLNMQKLGFGLTKAAVNTMIMQILHFQN